MEKNADEKNAREKSAEGKSTAERSTAEKSTAEKSTAQRWATPIQFLKGVGPRRAEMFARLGLHTARDAAFFFPRDYQDLNEVRPIADLEEGAVQSVRGAVVDVEQRPTRAGGSLLGVLIRDDESPLRALWFNQAFLREKFQPGRRVILTGKAKNREGAWEMSHPHIRWLDQQDDAQAGGMLPIYALTEGLRQHHVRQVVRQVLDECRDSLEEAFSESFRGEHDLPPLVEALESIHFPPDAESLARARRRFVYQELFVLQLALALRRQRLNEGRPAPVLEATAKIDARIRRLFPFELTTGQEQAIAEIRADLARPRPMSRLLEGDVGSGKTVPAVYALLTAVAHGCQAVLMAPTEVLARQHAATLEDLLAGSQVRRALLTGGLSSGARRDMLAAIAAGELDLVIGTQAVIQSDVEFAKLGLVIIDEQHRFGVRQRAGLKQGGHAPHYLVMSATPIPRSIAMTLFGDLDVSTLRELPPGRGIAHTYVITEEQRDRWWRFYTRKLREGRQGYVVAPLVEESTAVQAASVDEIHESLANGVLEPFRLGLLHGRLAVAEKQRVMDDFRRGAIQVLVATTVVEVGVDVPNATLMTIEGGECFGLAQLHQLRGRILRGSFPGYCGVFADPQTEAAAQRLKAFAETSDGFRLAEIDFQLRGAGELVGARQHGAGGLRIADLARDADLLAAARRDAQALIARDPRLERPEHARLLKLVVAHHGRDLDLADVG